MERWLVIVMLCAMSGCATATIGDAVKIAPAPQDLISSGTIENARMIGGDGLDWSTSLLRNEDGGYSLFGRTHKSFGESTDFYVLTYSSDDALQWAKTYGGTNVEMPLKAIHTQDHGLILAGSSQSMFYTCMKAFSPSWEARPIVIKLDPKGDVDWAWTFAPNAHYTEIRDVIELHDGSLILVGIYEEPQGEDECDTFAMKLSATGQKIWAYCYNTGIAEGGFAVAEAKDESIFISGYTKEKDSDAHLFVMNVAQDGAVLWSKKYEAPGDQLPLCMAKDDSGDFIIAGWSREKAGKPQAFLSAAIGQEGSMKWCNEYNNARNSKLFSLCKGYGTDYVLLGSSAKVQDDFVDGVALSIDNKGALLNDACIKGETNNEFQSLLTDKNGYYLVLGCTDSFKATMADILLFRWKPAQEISGTYSVQPLNCTIASINPGKTDFNGQVSEIKNFIAVKNIKKVEIAGVERAL